MLTIAGGLCAREGGQELGKRSLTLLLLTLLCTSTYTCVRGCHFPPVHPHRRALRMLQSAHVTHTLPRFDTGSGIQYSKPLPLPSTRSPLMPPPPTPSLVQLRRRCLPTPFYDLPLFVVPGCTGSSRRASSVSLRSCRATCRYIRASLGHVTRIRRLSRYPGRDTTRMKARSATAIFPLCLHPTLPPTGEPCACYNQHT